MVDIVYAKWHIRLSENKGTCWDLKRKRLSTGDLFSSLAVMAHEPYLT